jgi:hypothetical protein
MPCGEVSPDSRVLVLAACLAPGLSSTMRPLAGSLTSKSPSGVQVSIRASGTLAQTRAVHPVGTFTVRGAANAPPPRPGGTTRATLAPAAGAVLGAAVPEVLAGRAPPECADGEQAATARLVAAASAMSRGERMAKFISLVGATCIQRR